MARNPLLTTEARLTSAIRVYESAQKALSNARAALDRAMVDAVEAGHTRYHVAKKVGVSATRVSQIPGMPKGKNAVEVDDGPEAS